MTRQSTPRPLAVRQLSDKVTARCATGGASPWSEEAPAARFGQAVVQEEEKSTRMKGSCGDVVEPMSCMHGTRAVSVVMNQSNQTAVDGRGDARSAARHVY